MVVKSHLIAWLVDQLAFVVKLTYPAFYGTAATLVGARYYSYSVSTGIAVPGVLQASV